MPAIKIETFERQSRTTAASLLFGTAEVVHEFWQAEVEVGDDSLLCSRYDDESEWVVDGVIRNGWMPVYMNGAGSRCTILRLAPADVQAALDVRLAAAR